MKSAVTIATAWSILSAMSVNEDCQRQETVKQEGGDSDSEGSLDPSKVTSAMKSSQQEAQEA